MHGSIIMLLSFYACYCVDFADIALLALVRPCLFRLASTQHQWHLPWMCDQAYPSVALVNIVAVVKRYSVLAALTAHRLVGPQRVLMLACQGISVRMAQAC